MESNVSLKNVVLLIYNQCKEVNCALVNVKRIIDYITSTFDLNSEEANQLKISHLFQLLNDEGKQNNDLISEQQFEIILQLWIPLVHCENGQRMSENSNDDDIIFTGGVHDRLSRSLTNIKQQIDDELEREREHKLSFCQGWPCDNLDNDENLCSQMKKPHETLPRSPSPHEDPFMIPINVIKSTPIKLQSKKMSFLQHPNLRYVKPIPKADQASFSDTDACIHFEGSYFEDDSSENAGSNKDVNRYQNKRRKHRGSSVGLSDVDNVDTMDLLSQLKQIKFKNVQLEEINDRLQSQLEDAEENLRNLSGKCWNLEKKNKLFNALSEENKQFVQEIDDIRKCLENEIENKRLLLFEKIATEGELSVSKEHIQSLISKLNVLDGGLEDKNRMISSLKSMITQQEDFCSKLKELNLEKDEEIVKNETTMTGLTETIRIYEQKIDILVKEKNILETNYTALLPKDELDALCDKLDLNDDSMTEEKGCAAGLDSDQRLLFSTATEFRPRVANSPWSIKVELAQELVNCRGDNPLCEKMFFDDDEFLSTNDSDDSSYNMLKELLSVLSSLRMTLAQYKEHLETASITIRSNEHYSDEITLSYISYLDDSIHLLAASTEKAASCQNKFNETFEFLMKRISTLKNEKKKLILKNEQIQIQLRESSSDIEISVAEKICFLEEELRKERLSGSKKEKEIQELEKLRERSDGPVRCYHCGRSSLRFSASSEMNRQNLATEALNLEREFDKLQQRRVDFHRSFSNVENNVAYNDTDSWLKCDKSLSRKSSMSVDRLQSQEKREEEGTLLNEEDHCLIEGRNYYISTDDLLDTPRYKLSRAQPSNIDIDKIIENSWLETHSTMEERRASVFAYNSVDTSLPSPNDSTSDLEKSPVKVKARLRKSSSSCSSSNDNSDGNSIDFSVERKKLAQELESRNIRLQSRSPVPSSLGVCDDMKSITPTVNEEEQTRMWQDFSNNSSVDVYKQESSNNSPVSVVDECSATESVTMDMQQSSRRSSKQSVVINVYDIIPANSLVNGTSTSKNSLPTISIVEVPSEEFSESRGLDTTDSHIPDDVKTYSNVKKMSREPTLESDSNSLQASMNKSSLSSLTNSLAGDDSKVFRRSKQGLKKMRRPNTVSGISLTNPRMMQDDVSSNCEDQSITGDNNDIQDSIDLLEEMKHTLSNISPEELENKFNEMGLIYRTDRPTVIDRGNDANKRCSKALTNVDQEFNILRHLINSVTQVVDPTSEFVPRIKASISVLEKCVEYLSAKSEILGAVEQEIKMSSVIDVMSEYNLKLTKQREEHLRLLEEAKLYREAGNEICANGSFDQSRSKRSVLAGKDPKTRFQMLAQNTVMKSSIVRQFATSSFNRSAQLSSVSDNNDTFESPSYDQKTPFRRGTSNKALDCVDTFKKTSDTEIAKTRKYPASKFFSVAPSVEESGESLFHLGLQQGLRLSTDQALTEMRAEQSKFSSTLDSLSDLIEECDSPLEGATEAGLHFRMRVGAVRARLRVFFASLRIAVQRSLYLAVGFAVLVALLIPWLLTPAGPDTSSFSVPVSRRRGRSSPDSGDMSPSSSSSSPTFFSNVNVVRHRPAAV